MVNVIDKDILTVEEGIIGHQTNCFGPAGGLAGALFRKYPIVGKSYLDLVQTVTKNRGAWSLLGFTQGVHTSSKDEKLLVANMFGQYNISSKSRQTEYGSLYKALLHLKWLVEEVHPGPVYLPWKIGCGLGGGDWEIVYNMIEDVFKNTDVVCNICKHEKFL